MPASDKAPKRKGPGSGGSVSRQATESDVVSFQVSPRSTGGRSLFDATSVTPTNVHNYFSEQGIIDEASRRLLAQGIEVVKVSNTTLSVRARAEVVERVFGVRLNVAAVSTFEGAAGDQAVAASYLVVDMGEGKYLAPPPELADVIEGAVLPTPHEFMSPLPPAVPYHHLDVPADVNLLLNADEAHSLGTVGRGVRVAMVDTGFFRHPFYIHRGYHVDNAVLSPDSFGSDPLQDTNGHGTAELANACAVAPGARFMPVKTTLADPTAAFQTAVDLKPHIITNSWGRSLPTPPFNALPVNELPLAAAISAAVASGIVVCFSAGNGHIGWPAMHPDVIAVGGVFGRPDATFEASNYSSSFTTPIFPGRRVPDVCGLVGMLPRGIYIMLPLQPGSGIDVALAGGAFPNGDQTGANDGWACISGTSASSPQAAGAAALLLSVCPRLTPKEVRSILQATARDVTTGSTNPAANQPAGAHTAVLGADLATGAGLIDATAAVVSAMARCGDRCCEK